MKILRILLIAITLLGTMGVMNAQRTVVKVYPKYGTVVTKISRPKIIVHKNVRFHFADGVWYRARGKRYVVCAAPRGIQVRTLPRGNKVVLVNGRKLYKYKGIWYKKKDRGYVVVTV